MNMNFDSENFIYKNGLNVERYVFAEIRRVVAICFLSMSLGFIARGEFILEEAYREFNYAYNCDAYMRESYKTYAGRSFRTEDEFVAQRFDDDGTCSNNFYIWEGLFALYLFFLLALFFMTRGVKYRFDKKRRIIYTILNWNVYVYRVPVDVDTLKFETKYKTAEISPYINMTNISNSKERIQFLGFGKDDRLVMQEKLTLAAKMYFCEANQNSDDQWLRDVIDQNQTYTPFLRLFYFSLFKEASLDDPKLLAKIDAYLEKNPPNPAKDDLYKDFGFYNQG
jgi:hypothetical protein